MTELYPNDIIRVYQTDGISKTVLITNITSTMIYATEPPTTELSIPHKEGILEGIDKIIILHRSAPKGYAELHGFTLGKSVKLEIANHIIYGIIESHEEDMIGVSDGETTYYIDFEYEASPPLGISIELNEVLFDQDDEFIVKPSNQHRYNLEEQLADLLNSSMSPNMSVYKVQRQRIQNLRFKELYELYTLPSLQPKSVPHESLLHKQLVKWIQPRVDATRNLHDVNDVNMTSTFIRGIEEWMDSKDSYKNKYEKIFSVYVPVRQEGETVSEIVEGFIPRATTVKSERRNIYEVSRPWVNQVYAPYTLGSSDRIQRTGHIVHPWHSIQYSKLFLPNTELMLKVALNELSPFYKIRKCISTNPSLLFKQSVQMNELNVPSLPVIMKQPIGSYYSIDSFFSKIEPFLIYQHQTTSQYLPLIRTNLTQHIKSYKLAIRNVNVQDSDPIAPLPDEFNLDEYHYSNETISEWVLTMLREDNMQVGMNMLSLSLNHDAKSNISKYVDKEAKPLPPLAKVYKNIQQLKKDNFKDGKKEIYYDEALDPNSIFYDLVDKYDSNIKLIAKELQQVHSLTPYNASQLANDIIDKHKVIRPGDYAKLDSEFPAYYKRIGYEWKLDETCSDVPYSCATSNPTCIDTDTCDDSPFALKQNIVATMLNEYALDTYTGQHEFTKMKKKQLSHSILLKKKLKFIRREQMYKYNKSFLQLRVSKPSQVSPYESILHLILLKPNESKYVELLQFIRMYTRDAKEEDVEWKYCKQTQLKLIPVFLNVLANAYQDGSYEQKIIQYKQMSDFEQGDDGIWYHKHSGFPLDTAEYKESFDDLVRTGELESVELLDVPRMMTRFTKLLEELIILFTTAMRIQLVPYYTFMINGILHMTGEQNVGQMIIYCLGYVAALVDIYALTPSTKQCKDDYYHCLLNHVKPAILKIVQKNDLDANIEQLFEVTESYLQKEFKLISNKAEVKLLRQRQQNLTYVPIISSWTTFLPPRITHVVEVEGKDLNQLSMYIISTLYKLVHSKRPLIMTDQGPKKENACHLDLSESIFQDIHRMKHRYSNLALSIPKPVQPLQERLDQIKGVYNLDPKQIDVNELVIPGFEGIKNVPEFSSTLETKHRRLQAIGLNMINFTDWNEITPSYSIQFLQTMIRCIGSSYPMYIMSKLTLSDSDDSPIPVSMQKMLFPSHANLIETKVSNYYKPLDEYKTMSPHILTTILGSLEVKKILQDIQLPFHHVNADQLQLKYKEYIYSIFSIYIQEAGTQQDTVIQLLNTFIDMIKQDMEMINVSEDIIREQNLKIKLRETSRIKKRLQEATDDSYVTNMLRNFNLDEEAAEFRKQEYSTRAWELNERRLDEESHIANEYQHEQNEEIESALAEYEDESS
jgi:hypothetical protein